MSDECCEHVWYSEVAFESRVQEQDWCIKCAEDRELESADE